jgi:hypothetical protein
MIDGRVAARIADMIDHAVKTRQLCTAYGDVGERIAGDEEWSLLRSLSSALRADEVWLDGSTGIGGRFGRPGEGYVFGVVPHTQQLDVLQGEMAGHSRSEVQWVRESIVARFHEAGHTAYDWGMHS